MTRTATFPKPPSARAMLADRTIIRLPEPATLVSIALTAVLLVLVAFPLLKLLLVSLHTSAGAFTFGNYLAAYGRARYVESLWNSLLLATETAVISVVFAVPMAWAASRTNMPCKTLVWILVLGSFILPPYLGAIGWILLAGPNAGFINVAWRWVTGATGPLVNVYTFNGLAFVT